MKTICNVMKSYSLMFLMAAVCVVGFSACSEPDEEQFGNNDNIEGGVDKPSMNASFFVGTWYPATVLAESEFYRSQGNYNKAEELLAKSERITFQSNGNGNYKWSSSYSGNSDFTWKIKGDKIAVLWKGAKAEEYYEAYGYNTSYVTFVFNEGNATSWFADNSTPWQKK